MKKADAIHIRCPGSFGLAGALLAPLFSPRLIAKYAGQWNGYPGEPATVRLQRAVLRSRWWRGPVTVYGRWPHQPAHVIPFFTSVLTRDQLARASACAARRAFTPPLRALFVGRLSAAKNVDVLLRAIARVPMQCTVVGDGKERANLEALARTLSISDRVTFTGGLDFDRVLDEYERAHILVLVSETEGWPKAVAEAMAFGLVPIATGRGLIPKMLSEGRGFVVPPRNVDALAAVLNRLASDPREMSAISARAASWAAQYSLDGLREALRDLLATHWQGQALACPLTPGPRPPAPGPRAGLPPILHLTDTLDLGGYERVAVNLVNELPRHRFPAALCTTRRDGPLDAHIAPNVLRLRLARRGTFDPRAVLRLSQFIRAHGIRILHAHGPSLFIARAAAALPPWPAVIWHAHSGRLAAEDRAAWPYRLAASGIAGVIAVNQPLLEWTRRRLRLPASRTWYLPNLVAEPALPADPPDLPGTPASRIVCVANLRPEKDHATLLRAFAIVARALPETHLLLAGASPDPAYEQKLRAQAAALGIANRVAFLGRRDDVPAILRCSAAGVLSSTFEGLPMSLLEYGMAGLATVSTNAGQSAEVLDHGRAGILVAPGDAEALAAGLLSLLRSPEIRARLGDEFRRHVRERYGPAAVMPQLCAIYDTVCESHSLP